MPLFESAELIDLFTTYTAGPSSIGAHLAETVVRETEQDPLLVATGTDFALFPGDGSAPTIEGYRLSTRGFRELAAVSHLGPALATLARMREVDPDGGWRADAERLLEASKAPRGRPVRPGCGVTRSRSARSPAVRARSPPWSTTAAG